MPKYIVTGGAGFIGSHLVDKLMENHHTVLVIDNLSSGKQSNLEQWLNHDRFTLLSKDIQSLTTIPSSFKDAKAIFHLAAIPSVRRNT